MQLSKLMKDNLEKAEEQELTASNNLLLQVGNDLKSLPADKVAKNPSVSKTFDEEKLSSKVVIKDNDGNFYLVNLLSFFPSTLSEQDTPNMTYLAGLDVNGNVKKTPLSRFLTTPVIQDTMSNTLSFIGFDANGKFKKIPKGEFLVLNTSQSSYDHMESFIGIDENGNEKKTNVVGMFGKKTDIGTTMTEYNTQAGYWTTAGLQQGNRHARISLLNVSRVTISSTLSAPNNGIFACIIDENSNIIEKYECADVMDIPSAYRSYTLCVNWFERNNPDSLYPKSYFVRSIGDYGNKVVSISSEETEKFNSQNNNWFSIIDKPISFIGKRCYFFGDSIVEGYINSNTKTQNNWVKKFCASAGVTDYTNYGIGGSWFCNPATNGGSIAYKLLNTTLNCDILFIAGGTNDYTYMKDKSILRTNLQSICTHLQNNFNGKVIWITPINRLDHKYGYEKFELIRDTIFEFATTNGHSVIDGNSLGFPSESCYLSSKIFGDNVHPTEVGYTIYANALKSILL